MRFFRLAILLSCLALISFGCQDTATTDEDADGLLFATTIYPFRSILEPIVGERGSVRNLLPAGASPHTYDPRPSDARAAANALVLYYGAPELDAWGARLASERTVTLIDMLPDSMVRDLHSRQDAGGAAHGHSTGRDPHFWMDPLTVDALLPVLVDTLCAADPTYCTEYTENAGFFSERLSALHDSVKALIAPVASRSVLLSHPFLGYFLGRYGMRLAGVVEGIPGSEPTAHDMLRIVNDVRESGADAVLVLSQTPDRAARIVSETLSIPVIELDPIGGVDGRMTYEDLILYNAHTLRQALTPASDHPGRERSR